MGGDRIDEVLNEGTAVMAISELCDKAIDAGVGFN